MAVTGGIVRWVVEADLSAFNAGMKEASSKASDLSKELSGIDRATRDSLSNAAKNANNLKSSFGDLSASFSKVHAAGMDLFSPVVQGANLALNSVTALSGAVGSMIAQQAKSGIQGAEFVAKNNASFISLTGSIENANNAMAQAFKFYKGMNKDSVGSVFSRFPTIEAVNSILKYGASLQDVTKQLELLGKVSIASGRGIDELAELYGRATAQKKFGLNEYDQLVQAVPALNKELAKQLNIGTGEVRGFIDGKKIDTDKLIKAFEAVAANGALAMGKFTATLEYQSGRAKGRLADIGAALVGYSVDAEKGFQASEKGIYQSTVRLTKIFADTLAGSSATGQKMQKVMGRLGEAISPFIDKLADKLPGAISRVLDYVDKLAGGIESLGSKMLASEFDIKALIPIFAILGTQILGFVGSITGGAGGLLGALGGVGSAVGGVSAPVVALAFIFTRAMASSDEFRTAVGNLLGALGRLAGSLTSSFAQLASSDGVTKVLTAFVNILTTLADTIAKFPTPVLQGIMIAIAGGAAVGKIVGLGQALLGTASSIKKFGDALFGIGKTTASAVKGGNILAPIESMSSQMTKGQKMMITMRSGIINLVLMAGAIAALGYALKFAYESMPEDLGGLAAKMGLMGGVVLGMSILVALSNKMGSNAKSLFKLVLIAGSIAILAKSLEYANQAIPGDILEFGSKIINLGIGVGAIAILGGIVGKLGKHIIPGLGVLILISGTLAIAAKAIAYTNSVVPSDIASFASKVANMAIGIGAISVLAGVLGAIMATGVGALFLGAGLVALLGILGGMVAAAKAIAYVDSAVTSDVNGVKAKVDMLVAVIAHMAKANVGGLLENAVKAINMVAVNSIVNSYKDIAIKLALIAAIPLDKEAINSKITLIGDTLKLVSANDGDSIMKLAMEAAKNFVKNINVGQIGSIVDSYHNIATKLNEIQGVNIVPEVIQGKITLISGVIKDLSASGPGSPLNGIDKIISTFLQGEIIKNVSGIVSRYHEIATKLNEVQSVQLDDKAIDALLNKLHGVVRKLTLQGSTDWLQNISDSANTFFKAGTSQNVASIVGTYVSMIDNLKKLSFDWAQEAKGTEDNINTISRIVQTLVGQKGTGGVWNSLKSFATGGMISEDEMGKVQSLLNKFTEIAKTINGMESVDQGHNVPKITAVSSIISEIGKIPTGLAMGEKELLVGLAQSILNKFSGFAQTVNSLVEIGADKWDILRNIRHAVWEVCQVNADVGDMASKEWIVGMAQSMLNKFVGFSWTVNTIAPVQDGMLDNLRNVRHAVWEVCQINQDVGDLSNKEWIIGMGQSMLNKLIEFAWALTGLPQVNPAVQASIATLQATLSQVIGGVIGTLAGQIGNAYDAGAQLAAKLGQGILSQQGTVQSAGWGIQSAFWQSIQSKFPDHYWQGVALVGELINGFKSRTGEIWGVGNDIGNKFKEGVTAVGGYWQAGNNAISGFINGVESRNVYSVGWWVAEKFLRGLKDRAQQHSPWKTTIESGRFAAQGLAKGVQQSQSQVVNAATSLVDQVVDILSMDDITMSPSLDVSSNLAPDMYNDNTGVYGNPQQGRKSVVINQTNNNYTQYSVDQMVRDLKWELGKA